MCFADTLRSYGARVVNLVESYKHSAPPEPKKTYCFSGAKTGEPKDVITAETVTVVVAVEECSCRSRCPLECDDRGKRDLAVRTILDRMPVGLRATARV